jgi:hypothetical protein
MTTRLPQPVDVNATGALPVGALDRAPAPISAQTDPELPRTAPPARATAQTAAPVPPVDPELPQPVTVTVARPTTEQPAPDPYPVTAAQPALPTIEQPVDPAPVQPQDSGTGSSGTRYITVLANGAVVVSQTTAMNFVGNSVTVTASGSQANVNIQSYSNALAAAYGESGWAGNIVPSGNGLYSLGNANNRWSTVWVSSNTIYIGTAPVGVAANILTVAGQAVLSNNSNVSVTTTGSVTANAFAGNGSLLTGVVASTVAWANVTSAPSFITLANLSVTTAAPSGNGSLSYNNTSGVFTFTPADAALSQYGNANVVTLLGAFGSNAVSTTGNVTANYFVGNGSQLTGLPASYSNANVTTLLSAFGSNAISTTGNVTANYFVGNGSQLTGIAASYGNANVATFLAAYGSNTITTTGNITAGNLIGNISITGNVQGTTANVTLVAGIYSTVFDNTGNLTLPGNTFAVNYANNTPVDVVTRFESSWTVPTGNSTQSFTVPINNTYQLWINSNIPNGIIVYNATVSVSNTNVPVIGYQYAWNYEGGGNILAFTSIPNQIIGTAGAISNAQPAVANTNVFSFGINNTSGGNVTVRYGWIQIS